MHHLFTQASECLVLKFPWSCHHLKSVAPSAKRASNPLSKPMSIWGVVPILWLWFHLASGVQLIYFCSIGVQALNLIPPPFFWAWLKWLQRSAAIFKGHLFQQWFLNLHAISPYDLLGRRLFSPLHELFTFRPAFTAVLAAYATIPQSPTNWFCNSSPAPASWPSTAPKINQVVASADVIQYAFHRRW